MVTIYQLTEGTQTKQGVVSHLEEDIIDDMMGEASAYNVVMKDGSVHSLFDIELV